MNNESNLVVSETTEQNAISEYNELVLQRLDNIEGLLSHQYTVSLFTIGCLSAVFVCVLLYKFLLRAFY